MFHATKWETNNCNTLIAQWPNVSRDKGNQKMEFGHLKEYNTRNIFLKCHTRNMVEKLVSNALRKSQN